MNKHPFGIIIVIALSVLSLGAASRALAADCSATIQADDALRFNLEHIDIPGTCKDFTVTLNHTGRLAKAAMGHNWVLVKAEDAAGVARTSMIAGAPHNYIDPDDKRVIAHTGLIGRGESTSVTFAAKQLDPGVTYVFLCTFAGHSPLMQGTVSIKP